ncbi:hypothetical protein HAL07_05860 [Helicobacter ailurogastricus]|uniref:Uncharacterized protein n=1 Tax=Helicobacter ailurogastricus TaxID=1578720 RepID=A0A0K2Y5P9_9HELI|nr:hypothetical protein HAL07_05860 [Helicobacter ailurogastricus]
MNTPFFSALSGAEKAPIPKTRALSENRKLGFRLDTII